MSKKPEHKAYGGSVSEWIALAPGELNDLPVGMWKIVDHGRDGFGLEGPALADFIRRSIYALMDAGAKPVAGGNKPNYGIDARMDRNLGCGSATSMG